MHVPHSPISSTSFRLQNKSNLVESGEMMCQSNAQCYKVKPLWGFNRLIVWKFKAKDSEVAPCLTRAGIDCHIRDRKLSILPVGFEQRANQF
jgi:hypothetical protein